MKLTNTDKCFIGVLTFLIGLIIFLIVGGKQVVEEDNKVDIKTALVIYKAGYVVGAMRQLEGNDVRDTWEMDSVLFLNYFKPSKNEKAN